MTLRRQATAAPPFDPQSVRADFPALDLAVRGKPLVYLDNAATAQKPQAVIDRLERYYSTENSNVHRGVHYLSEVATEAYEGTRKKLQQFLNAASTCEIVFVRGTTEGINLVSNSYGRTNAKEGDEIIVSAMEHHSNIVPWQILCQQTGAQLRVVPVTDTGELDMGQFEVMLGPRTRLVSIVHMSNALGTINPVRRIIELAHQRGVPVLLDGAQAACHLPVDVQELDCDFYTFSGHKLFGPTGIGVLYGKERLLDKMPPYQGGGDMISSVSFEKTLYNELPYKFEAGTPNIAGVVGLGAAVDYLSGIGWEGIAAYENGLLEYATDQVGGIEGVRLIGTAEEKASILSFVIEDIHPHDIGTVLDREGVAIRAGHHCCQPLMHRFDVAGTARASLAMYNNHQDIDRLAAAVHKAIGVLT